MPINNDPMNSVCSCAFFQEGCATLGRNVCEAIALAGEPVTRDTIIAFVKTLPRDRHDLSTEEWQGGCCNRCLKTIDFQSNAPADRKNRLYEYFLRYFPELSTPAKYLLADAFVGVLSGVDLVPVASPATER